MAIRNFAEEAFRSQAGGSLMPRQKFNFIIIFDLAIGESITFGRVRTVSTPGVNFDTQIMNQYNKKRVVQTKMNYDPVTVEFYDTYDSQFTYLMRNYVKHYYNMDSGLNRRVTTEGRQVIGLDFETDLGYTPVTENNRYFFPSIRIIQNGYQNQWRETKLINPMMVSVQGDTLDYGSSEAMMFTAVFQPESIQYQNRSDGFQPDLTIPTTPGGNTSGPGR